MYNRVAQFMIESYYLDGDGSALRGLQRRRLEGDQAADLRQRYSRSPAREAAVLVASGRGGRDIGGCVGIVVVPFTERGRPDTSLDAMPTADQHAAPVIGNLAVAKPLRRQGVGRQLMAEAEATCREWGFDEVWLGVEAGNSKARRLYRKLGFKEKYTAKEPAVRVIDGDVVEETATNVYMRKSLRGGLAGAVDNAPWGLVAAGAALVAAASAGRGPAAQELLHAVLLDRWGH